MEQQHNAIIWSDNKLNNDHLKVALSVCESLIIAATRAIVVSVWAPLTDR